MELSTPFTETETAAFMGPGIGGVTQATASLLSHVAFVESIVLSPRSFALANRHVCSADFTNPDPCSVICEPPVVDPMLGLRLSKTAPSTKWNPNPFVNVPLECIPTPSRTSPAGADGELHVSRMSDATVAGTTTPPNEHTASPPKPVP